MSEEKRSFLSLEGLGKRFGDHEVLRAIDLDVGEGEVLALLGPSGSGKTTALRLLAGFEVPDSGRIRVGGEDVTGQPAAKRGFGMVFQHYALFPHLDVGANVAFGLETRGWSRERIAARVAEVLDLVGLTGFEARRPGEISGGQQQRVALARALAPEPKLLLLDEPLSNLDPSLRERTRRQLRQVVERVGITTVLVTHEQEEAFHLGDRVAVLHQGTLQQVGLPEELYERPRTRFVATFVGRAAALPGRLEGRDGEVGRVSLGAAGDGQSWSGALGETVEAGAAVELVVRPETLAFAPPGAAGGLGGRVVGRRFNGPITYYEVQPELQGLPELEVLADAGAAQVGDTVVVAPSGTGPAPRIFARPVEKTP
ncbi:MAG: ABC transporter ATP-binding protein [Acidobacteria bacterium]|nr:ABC transporter ATP-binding protein [Acidobacteriota bacterium]